MSGFTIWYPWLMFISEVSETSFVCKIGDFAKKMSIFAL